MEFNSFSQPQNHPSQGNAPFDASVPTNSHVDQMQGDTNLQANLVDLMMLTGESGIDEQWMSFMRDSGILDPAASIPQGSHVANIGIPGPVMSAFS